METALTINCRLTAIMFLPHVQPTVRYRDIFGDNVAHEIMFWRVFIYYEFLHAAIDTLPDRFGATVHS